MWEIEDLPVGEVDWHALYMTVKAASRDLKGLRKRKSVWRCVEKICAKMEVEMSKIQPW